MQTTTDFILSAKEGNEMHANRSLAFAGGFLGLGFTSGIIFSFYSCVLLVIAVLIFSSLTLLNLITYALNKLENRKLTNLQVAMESLTSKEEVLSKLNSFEGE